MKNINAAWFVFKLSCSACGAQLNQSHQVLGVHVRTLYQGLAMSAPLNSGVCPAGCRPTFSDCNLRTKLEILDVATQRVIAFATFTFLAGHFYSEDYVKVCDCDGREDAELYESAKYPAMHGPCGRWLQPFRGDLRKAS